MKAICHNLEKASEQGLFKDKTVLRDFLTTISKNLHVKKQGKHYKASTKLFFEVVLIWGGPRLATFVVSNLFGPKIHSLYRWRSRDCITLEGGINHADMSQIAVIYSESIAKQLKNEQRKRGKFSSSSGCRRRNCSYQQNYVQSGKRRAVGVLWCQRSKPSVP